MPLSKCPFWIFLFLVFGGEIFETRGWQGTRLRLLCRIPRAGGFFRVCWKADGISSHEFFRISREIRIAGVGGNRVLRCFDRVHALIL